MWYSLYAAYLVIGAAAIVVGYREQKREWAMRFLIIAALPVIGFLMPLFWPKRWQDSDESKEERFNQIVRIERTDDWEILARPVGSAEKEMNVVPLEEALLVNDLSTRRKMMIDLLKKDTLEYIDVIQMAVRNEDTETSHYAVSAIVELKRKLTLAIQELSVKFEEDKSDPYLLRAYADVLKAYMNSGYLDERTLLKHKITYVDLLDRLIAASPELPATYEDKVDTELELNRLDAAEETGKLYLERFPRLEGAYLSLMKVYYYRRSYAQLQAVKESLQQSPLRLSNQALTAVRFWSTKESG